MMKGLYSSPLRVYLCLAALAVAGIYSGMQLPISLFPNSSRPSVSVNLSYGKMTAEEFLNSYGKRFENQYQNILTDHLAVEKVEATYGRSDVSYAIKFKWGSPSQAAVREVQTITNSLTASLPLEIRDSAQVFSYNRNSGFMAISFYSPTRSLDELYDILDPLLIPRLSKVEDANDPELWNPNEKEVQIELSPEKLASLQVMPTDIERALDSALNGHNGGMLETEGGQFSIQMPRSAMTLEDLGRTPVMTGAGTSVHLNDLGKIDYSVRSSNTRSFKTSGAASLILIAHPKPSGNVKRMSEEIIKLVQDAMPAAPKDIQYKVLVDPSEFIRSAVNNVMHEVFVGAMLAVVILFLFVGSFRNTVTAAIEIPMSMVLAFILMRMTDMNLNLISLGGLALSSGMNVDASVVVMENIFRHFEGVKGKLSFSERVRIVVAAVKEVQFSVMASTVASLVVFLPLAMTSGLSNAILGDLAMAVVFSHGFSAFVALILVPTVRLHLMSRPGGDVHPVSPIEPQIRWLENTYARLLDVFIRKKTLKLGTYAGLIVVLAALMTFVLPRLPREVIGKPDTDWMILIVSASSNTVFNQMESQTEEIEAGLLKDFGHEIQYTFTQIASVQSAVVMARLKDKSKMKEVWKAMEKKYVNTPFIRFMVEAWNPAELPIPDPPQMRIVVQGGTLAERAEATRQVHELLEEKQILPQVWTEPTLSRGESIVLRSNPDQWMALRGGKISLAPGDLADLVRVATLGRKVGEMPIQGRNVNIYMRFPENRVKSADDIGSLPIGTGSKLIPLRALTRVQMEEVAPMIYRENGREAFLIQGRKLMGSENKTDHSYLEKAKAVVAEWTAKKQAEKKGASVPSIIFEDAEKELNDALYQLAWAVGFSIALVLLTLIIQFGNVINAVLVLVAIPLGFIGVLISLYVFGSTLSLNSALGVILLNGIAVANSIILVDFQKRLVDQGMSPHDAALEAGKKRLRPILITSLTTILAMMPIAIGFGEGGRILQPLGIAVSGGLWVSMGLTLFVVPALQVSYLTSRKKKAETQLSRAAIEARIPEMTH